MKNRYQRVLLWFLALALIIPVLTTVAGPVIAATTSGYIGNMDPELVKNVIAPAEQPTINLENSGGLRFATNINLEKYAALKAFCKQRRIKGVSMGTIIAPLDYVKEAGEFSTMALDFLERKTSYLDIKSNTELFYDGEKTLAEGYDEQFVASLINIKLENRTRAFAAIGYIQLTLADGSFFTIYSYDNQDMALVEKYSASLADVAEEALQKDGWSEEERAMIVDLAQGEQTLNVETETVKDVRLTRSRLYFTYIDPKKGETFYNCISYNGANGWRLQSNTQSYNHFKDIGAGQALAMYLDEGFGDVTIPLTVTQTDSGLIIRAKGTDTYTQMNLETFALDFCTVDGESLYNVHTMTISNQGEVVLKGKMNKTDAVYGGGERFDNSNNRGKIMNLYTSDSYDTKGGSGTYVVVPLFSTSRGGGMFINKYEPMTVGFPYKNVEGDWTLTIDTDFLDCYFYATGNISDVLQAYTDLTGHATLPEEWAQGYIVCRFAPDFTSIEGEAGDGVSWYYNIEDIPNYSRYEYTVTVNGSTTKKKLEIGDVLPHKKALTINGISYYHYIIESDTEDFNYNGITGESYFLRVSSKGGPAGAGVAYIVDSLIEAGMRPTAVILEGVTWYNMAKDAAQWANLKKFVEYLNSRNIKSIVYTALGHLTGGGMSDQFKTEYMLIADFYEYDDVNGISKKLTSSTGIPKSDKTDNPDTVSDGTQSYLDITHPGAVKWYTDVIWSEMMELGVDGLKVDFSESLPNEGVYRNMKINGVTYEKVYIKLRWHDPSMFEEKEPHHAYASYFVSMVNKEMNEKAAERDDDNGFIMLARGGGIGLQRNPYMLAGDQTRRFRNLSTQLAAVINSGISGIPFVTYDMGGYAYYGTSYHYYGGQPQTVVEDNGTISLPNMQAAEEYESEIFVRALQFTAFGAVIKTHGDVRNVYQMTEEAQELSALYFALHEELAGYLRELSVIACDTGMPMIRHLVLEYQDDANVYDVTDQFMFGDGLLVAPILTCNTKQEGGQLLLDYASVATRTVYLPAGEWIDLNTGETIVSDGMTLTVDANLAQIPVYLNTASAHAEELQTIFAGDTWQAIVAYANALDNAQ